MPGGSRFWWILLALLALNWFIVSLIPSGEEPPRRAVHAVPRAGARRGTSARSPRSGDTIQGTFKKEVTYPEGSDTNEHGVRHRAPGVRRRRAAAAPDRPGRGGQRQAGRRGALAAGDAAALVRPGDPAGAAVRVPDAPGRAAARAGRSPGLGRSRAKRYDARRAAGDVRGRGGHRRGRGRARRDRRLPAQPGPLPPSRRARSRAACCCRGRPGTGKTLLARAVAGEAERALLLAVGLGVRRDDRGRRRQPRARPVRPGEGDGAGDHLHRRARRDRPGPRRLGVDRRQRRARADAQPDPHRDGRVQRHRGRHRARGDQPARRSSTRRCCGPGASTGGWSSTRPTATAASRS